MALYTVDGPTAGSEVAGIYWRMQWKGGGADQYTYAREVGRTDAATRWARTTRLVCGFPLNVDENKQVEYSMQGSNTLSWIFGYVEEYTRRSRSKVVEL